MLCKKWRDTAKIIQNICNDELCKRDHPITDGVCWELLEYAEGEGIPSGPIFCTRDGKPIDRSDVTMAIQCLRTMACVPGEKGSPRCLRKLHQTTRSGIECNIALLVEQAQDRLLQEEQLPIGWGQ